MGVMLFQHCPVHISEVVQCGRAIAKYMLVTCSAFVTYLLEAGRKGRLV